MSAILPSVFLVTIICCATLLENSMCRVLTHRSHTVYSNTSALLTDERRESLRNRSTNVLTWTPWEVVNRATIDGKEIVFRIVNGQPATAGEFPYQISLRQRVGKLYMTYCGASIIQPRVILSAAHCFVTNEFAGFCRTVGQVSRRNMNGRYAVAGTLHAVSHYHGKVDTDEFGQWRKLKKGFYPADYRFPKSDICVVFVVKPYLWTKLVQPVALATRHLEYQGPCMASGYGRNENDQRSTHLMKASLAIIQTSLCTRYHYRNMRKFVCTSDETNNVGKGDSGGPLLCTGTGDPSDSSKGILAGVVCGGVRRQGKGSFMTRVSSYRAFIQKSLEDVATRPVLSLPLLVLSSMLSCSV